MSEVEASVTQKQVFSTRNRKFLLPTLASQAYSAFCVGVVASRLWFFQKTIDAKNEQRLSTQFTENGLPFLSFLKKLGDAVFSFSGLDVSFKLCEIQPDTRKRKEPTC